MEEMAAFFSKRADDVRDVCDAAMFEAGERIAERVRRTALRMGVDAEIADAIVVHRDQDGEVAIGVPPDDPRSATALDVEYGSWGSPARPALRSALKRDEREIQEDLSQTLERRLLEPGSSA
jgi:hypothetical protein